MACRFLWVIQYLIGNGFYVVLVRPAILAEWFFKAGVSHAVDPAWPASYLLKML